tara:strand:+ start:546 stop:1511 length:966 start_codon:yes stop_codon:yes gene_type:complete
MHAERQAFRSWMTPLLRADVPRRRVPGYAPADRALAHLEGIELDTQAHWLRGAIVASIATAPRGANRVGGQWRRRALTVFAFREVEEDLLPWRRVRSRALRALRQHPGLQLPLNLHAALRFEPAELHVGTLRELTELACALDGSLDSMVLQAASDWLAGDPDRAWSRLDAADALAAPAHQPAVTRRWQACLRAFLREDEGDLEGALEALDDSTEPDQPRLDHAVLRIALATFTQDLERIEREIPVLLPAHVRESQVAGARETGRGELGAALLPRIERWRRLRPGALPLRVRRMLRSWRHASSRASGHLPFTVASHLLGESA